MKNTLALLGFAACLSALPAYAGTADIRASDRVVDAQLGGGNLKYGESNQGTSNSLPDMLDTETGWMPSFDIGGTWLMRNDQSWTSNLYFHIDLESTVGQTHYNGYLQSLSPPYTLTPYQSTTNDEIYHVSGKIGRLFELSEGVALTPYLDLGFRSWNRDLTGIGGYNELYQNGEGKGGLLLQVSPMQRLVLSAAGDVGSTFGGNLRAQGQNFSLGDDVVWSVEGRAGYAITPSFELITTARFEGFGFGRSSAAKIRPYEPDSYTHQLSLMGGLAYHLPW